MKKPLILTVISLISLSSCQKEDLNMERPIDQEIAGIVAKEDLDETTLNSFNEHEKWTGTVHVEGYDGPLAHVPLTLMDGTEILEIGWTNAQGNWNLVLNHTNNLDLHILCELPTIEGDKAIHHDGFSLDFTPDALVPLSSTYGTSSNKTGQSSVVFRGRDNWYDDRTYTLQASRDNQYLPVMETPESLSNDFLTYIANSLPEQYPVGIHNPSLLADGVTSIHLSESGDVFMTFVSEGAGFTNAVGYFTWQDGYEPTSKSDIDTIYTAFENFSRLYSGGGLQAGDKIYIGSYPAGTNIGFALIANGYNGHGANYRAGNIYYSLPDLNPESSASTRLHNVVLRDENTDRFVISFEDLWREGSSDEDFNDAIFYCTANPPTAIDTTGVSEVLYELNDCDYDGVPDVADIAPCDSRYATLYSTSGKVFFEDMYPYLGDYDFNDVVINYEATAWKSGSGITNKMVYNFEQIADGGTYLNGIGLAFDELLATQVSNVEFGDAAGTFEEDDAAVFILSQNSEWSGHTFVNTIPTQTPITEYLNYSVSFEINGATASDIFWGSALDLFIFQNESDGSRNEIHLKYKRPTSKANALKIGEGDDITLLENTLFYGNQWSNGTNSLRYWASTMAQSDTFMVPASSVTYTDRNGYPWAMHLNNQVKHPYEKIPITEAYPNFSSWIGSGGLTATQWFESFISGKVFE
jgi:LruC domain-containing protein